MEKNEIIEAECREITPDAEFIRLANEIKFITEQTRAVLGRSMFEIGKRFAKTKSLVPYGQWGEICEKYTGYSQSMAENYIRIYEECASEQQTLFEDPLEVLEKFGITKAVELLAIPASMRKEFVEKNNITEKNTTVKELKELISKQKADIEAAQQKTADAERELEAAIERSNQQINEKMAEIERLKKELEQRESDPLPSPETDFEEMLAQQEEQIKKSMQEEIDRLEQDKKKAEDKTAKLQKKFDKLKAVSDKSEEDVNKLKNRLSEETDKNKSLLEEIRKLQKESMFGANEKMVKLNIQFETVQNDISTLSAALEAIKDSETYEKLKGAIYQTLKSRLKELA